MAMGRSACSTHLVFAPDEIDAVVFDMGGVFLVPAPEPIRGVLREAGVEVGFDGDDAHHAHYRGVRGITELLAHTVVEEREAGTWFHYDKAYFGSIGLSGADLERTIAARDRIRRAESVENVWTFELEHNIGAFARISTQRPVAIVTNNNGTAVQQCLDHRICQLDDGPLPRAAAIVDSTVIQIAKPDPRIFQPALDALGTQPSRTLYVGDTVHADIHGAEAAGMPAVQLDPLDLHDDHSHWRLPDVMSLADHLSS